MGCSSCGGLRRDWRSSCSAIVVPYTLVVASFGMWWGGWSAPARFLDSLMPLAVPLLALAWRNAGRTRRGVFVALVLVSVANLVTRLVVLNGGLLYNYRDGFDLLLDWLSRARERAAGAAQRPSSGPRVAMLVTVVWSAVVAIVLALLTWWTARVATRGAQWGATAAMGYSWRWPDLSVTWGLTGTPAVVTPESSQTAFIRRWRPERQVGGCAVARDAPDRSPGCGGRSGPPDLVAGPRRPAAIGRCWRFRGSRRATIASRSKERRSSPER